ncbi:MAG: SDR family NAD(P)-dependent oxidoreductase [Pirellulaceae bacterium]|jgi:3-oxoacyl-[acyl-carrier protein] reductase|nr:SDR family NAD(P)-dependent oxidoreductase [Pirellulaceae bacterium]
MRPSNDLETRDDRLCGQTAVVTGAAQGLGLGIAKMLARRGACVIIADLQQEKARHAAEALCDQNLKVEADQLDIGQSRAVNNFFQGVSDRHGGLNILVNNAGVGQNVAPLIELDDAEWERVIHISLTGTFYCCRAAGKLMEQRESGSIVNIASINGQNPAPLVAAYNVAKAGVISLTRTLALEMAAYGVRVNAVCPGPVYTDFNRSVMAQRCKNLDVTEKAMIEKIRSAIPLGRWGEPDDIANAVTFLCSSHSSWMTGEVLRVSGGMEGVSAAPLKRKRP